jgi:hypothetical protein
MLRQLEKFSYWQTFPIDNRFPIGILCACQSITRKDTAMINTEKFNQIVETAKAKAAGQPQWIRAIEKAARMMAGGELCVTLFADNTALVTSPNGSYRVNGHCPCAARTAHCYHRCAKRLAELIDEARLAEAAALRCDAIIEDIKAIAADVQASPRKQLIAEIENIWPRVESTPLAVELMARFRVNKLEFLDEDQLRRVRLAVAM